VIAGTLACGKVSEGEGHLRGMAVRAAWQGAGVAQALLERAESELRAQGCSRVTLDTTLPLERAMRFYEKNGYQRSGRVADFFGMVLIEYEKAISN
jgi:GNAT superfamily N-acetyltransferase